MLTVCDHWISPVLQSPRITLSGILLANGHMLIPCRFDESQGFSFAAIFFFFWSLCCLCACLVSVDYQKIWVSMTSLRIQAAMASEPIYSYDSKITSEDYDCINNLFKWLSDIPVSMTSSWGWGGYWPSVWKLKYLHIFISFAILIKVFK